MIEIDGAHGEGGGQLVRTAVAVSAVRGVPVRIINIRARRRKPGLAAQHVAAVRAVAALCDAQCEGVEAGSQSLSFVPRRLRGGEFRVDVGTAGSITLVLQAMLPAAVATREPVSVNIRGGTDVRAAPPLDYLRLVLLPLLARTGIQCGIDVMRRGYYPKGGGEVQLRIAPAARVQPLAVEALGTIARIEVHAHVALLPLQIAQRMAAAARALLPADVDVTEHLELCPPGFAAGPGGAIVLRAVCAHGVLGAGEVAQRGVPAEQLGHAAGESLLHDINAGATLDIHALDQMLVFLALAEGSSVVRAAHASSHATTTMWLLERLALARFTTLPGDRGVVVHVHPAT
jgi:RNA 3'-terminal phosphate cyclase (ATP)